MNSLDCNVFTAAFLYLKWITGVDPKDIKNQRLLCDIMKNLIDKEVVYKSDAERGFNFLIRATDLYEHLNKRLGCLIRMSLIKGHIIHWLKF